MSKATTQKASATTVGSDIEALTNELSRLDVLLGKNELSEEEDVNVAELLKRLESAEGMAGEVEAKVDDILEKLDELMQEMDKQEKVGIEGGGVETPKARVD